MNQQTERYHVLVPKKAVKVPGEPLYDIVTMGKELAPLIQHAREFADFNDIREIYVFDTKNHFTAWSQKRGAL